jgi:hypothetical protein
MLLANACTAAVTLLLFVLWFRYMCSLLLAAQTSLDRSDDVAQSNSLAFADVLRDLHEQQDQIPLAALDIHEQALRRDLEILTYLLRHMGQRDLGDSAIEVWMLRTDFRIQAVFYSMYRRASLTRAREQVYRMAIILSHFANTVGERTAPVRR